MEHIKIFWSRMNVPKLLRACEAARLWDEAVYLYKEDDQYDSAIKIMMEHSTAFQHDLFLDCAQKVRNSELYYKAIAFYLEQQPMSLVRLLQVLTPNLDHSRVVHQLRKLENLPLVLPYLKSVQKENLSAVNEAVNELYIEDEDYESLHQSIDDYDNFDQIALAQKIEKHELLEFRRIAAYLYKKNKRWQQSVSLSKADKMYKDAIETTFSSGDPELSEELLALLVHRDRECFCATLLTTYTLVKPGRRHRACVAQRLPGLCDAVRHPVHAAPARESLAELEKRTAPRRKPRRPRMRRTRQCRARCASTCLFARGRVSRLCEGRSHVLAPPDLHPRRPVTAGTRRHSPSRTAATEWTRRAACRGMPPGSCRHAGHATDAAAGHTGPTRCRLQRRATARDRWGGSAAGWCSGGQRRARLPGRARGRLRALSSSHCFRVWPRPSSFTVLRPLHFVVCNPGAGVRRARVSANCKWENWCTGEPARY